MLNNLTYGVYVEGGCDDNVPARTGVGQVWTGHGVSKKGSIIYGVHFHCVKKSANIIFHAVSQLVKEKNLI